MPVESSNTGAGSRSVTLFVPGMRLHDASQLRQIVGPQPPLNALQLLLSRADYRKGNSKTPEDTLFELFNVAHARSVDLPVGALTCYLTTGNESRGLWAMRADPVLIQPNRDHLILLGNSGLNIQLEEAQQITSDINQTYHDTQWRIDMVTPSQWVIVQQPPEQLNTQPLSSVVGKNISDCLPKGENQKKWRTLLNELQMFLHAHPVNQHRQLQGSPIINSLWFWGAGVLPVVATGDTERPFVQCWSGETISLALARLSNVPRADLPQNAETWLRQAITPGRHLLVVEGLSNEVAASDPVQWRQLFADFDKQWLSALVNAVKQKNIDQLSVLDSGGSCYFLTRRLAKRWWKLGSRI